MTLNEYQRKAMTTCMTSCDNISYMLLNLVGEVGEFSSKVAKHIRKEEAYIGMEGDSQLYWADTISDDEAVHNRELLSKELGDILWQLSGLCHVMGFSLEDIAQQNLDKLADRAKRNKIDGNGDER